MDSFSLIDAAKKFLCNGRQLSLVEEKGHSSSRNICLIDLITNLGVTSPRSKGTV